MAGKGKIKDIPRWVRRHQLKHLCGCNCGEFIQVNKTHARPSVGIPKYIKGHNLKPVSPATQEESTKNNSWDKLTEEEKRVRLSHLKSFKKGKDNPSWKGGRRIDENGYIRILLPDHPFAKDGYVAEHRLNVEERTKKYFPNHPLLIKVNGNSYLNPKSVVHHIDEVKSNNNPGTGPDDIGNLMLLANQAAHSFIHHSPLPMQERLRRIEIGVFHSKPLNEE